MSDDFHFTTKEGRILLGLLKDAGEPLRYSEIVKQMKAKRVLESKTNDLLKELSKKNLILKIDKGRKKVFYRLNDFPPEVKVLLSGLDVMEEQEPEMKWMFEVWKQNIVLFYPKVDMDKIADLTLSEVKAEYENDPFMQKILRNLKEMME